MRVAVIGSRGFADYDRMVKTLNNIKITEIVSGGAKGADSLGEKYANEKEIPTNIFLPDWEQFGKNAGFLRNVDIIENCDLVVAFWDSESKGTLHSINLAKEKNKRVLIIEYTK
jgi:hypothetical protein